MKKTLILLIVSLMALNFVGCRKHVFHTYYGDIDIDTMSVTLIDEGEKYYTVDSVAKDSFYWLDRWFYIMGPVVRYYCPKNNKYIELSPDNQGNISGGEIDPYQNWLKE